MCIQSLCCFFNLTWFKSYVINQSHHYMYLFKLYMELASCMHKDIFICMVSIWSLIRAIFSCKMPIVKQFQQYIVLKVVVEIDRGIPCCRNCFENTESPSMVRQTNSSQNCLYKCISRLITSSVNSYFCNTEVYKNISQRI